MLRLSTDPTRVVIAEAEDQYGQHCFRAVASPEDPDQLTVNIVSAGVELSSYTWDRATAGEFLLNCLLGDEGWTVRTETVQADSKRGDF